MKNLKLFIFVLALALCLSVSAFAEDTHFTCESDINDFNGKTFDNLYLDLVSCGENVEFTDLTVTGNLVYNGGRDTVDHNLKFVHPSIQSMFVPCESTHNCTISFVPSEDIEYVVSEMTVMPTGSEKGKIVLYGSGSLDLTANYTYSIPYGRLYRPDENGYYRPVLSDTKEVTSSFCKTKINRINYISGDITDEVSAGFRNNTSIPAQVTVDSVSETNVQVEINIIEVTEMSVVSMNETIIPSVTTNSMYDIYMLAAYAPALRLFSYSTGEHTPYIQALLAAVDGDNFTLSLDKTIVYIIHFFGNNKENSNLSLLVGNEAVHNRAGLIKNLFLFGANMEFLGYGMPNKRVLDMNRVVITEQADEYGLRPTPSILNEYLEKYFIPTDIPDSAWIDNTKYSVDEIPSNLQDYKDWLDVDYVFCNQYIDSIAKLSQQYAINYPNSSKNWSPEINLSYANIGKVICAKEITNRIDPYQMIHINHESYTNMKQDVQRFVMLEGVTASLAEEPVVTTQNMLDDLFADLPDGCYTFSLDQYGRPYLVD